MLPEHEVRFQLCTPATCRRLARFVHGIVERHPGGEAELVINGDFVDFLAEEKIDAKEPVFEAVTSAKDAIKKLERVMERCHEGAPPDERVFEALRALVQKNLRLTILVGNHDVELSLPSVRAWLMRWLTGGKPHRVEFLYDGEAYLRDGLLVEHGNRYDGWNAIDHGALRAARSRLSRGEPDWTIVAPPGSRLVVEVMNEIKLRYPFVDMLKPENEALIPLLAAIDRKLLGSVQRIWRSASLGVAQMRRAPKAGAVPEKESMISSETGQPTQPFTGEDPDAAKRTARLLASAMPRDTAVTESESEVGLREAATGLVRTIASFWPVLTSTQKSQWGALYDAWREYAREIGATFALGEELPRYLAAATRLCPPQGVVVFGHTHLAKSVGLPNGRYLNSGTWVPTIELPAETYDGSIDCDGAISAVESFVGALCKGDAPLRHQCTFVHVEWEHGRPRAVLKEFLESGREQVLDGP